MSTLDVFEAELAMLIERSGMWLTDDQIIHALERALDEALVTAGEPEASKALQVALQERDTAKAEAARTLATAQAVDRAACRLEAQKNRLQTALRYFLDDARFQVSVGGNPTLVDKALSYARMALATADSRSENNPNVIATAPFDNPEVIA
jgi:hypothetical protein